MNESDLLELIKLSISGATVDSRATISPKKSAASPAANPDGDATSSETIGDISPASEAEGTEAPQNSSPVHRFEVLGEIGRGGMGVVYRARQVDLDRDVALKRLHEGSRGDACVQSSLLQEAMVTGFLEHPNIIPVHVTDLADETVSVVMKLVGGQSWSTVIAEDRDGEILNRKKLEKHLRILLSVMNAVAFAHSHQILHRDLKPDNVMIGEFGEILVMDWGLAVSFSEEVRDAPTRIPHRSFQTTLAGTPAYMAPEMARAAGSELGPWSDVYLLGGILHDLLCGQPPHVGNNLLEVLKSAARGNAPEFPERVPEELARIATIALSDSPADRFQSVQDFQSALTRYLESQESFALTEKAQTELESLQSRFASGVDRGNRAGLYREIDAVLAGFEQALFLLPNNPAAEDGREQATTLYTETAIESGDLGLAQASLEILEDRYAGSGTQAARQKFEEAVARRQRTLRFSRSIAWSLLALQLIVGVGLSTFLYFRLQQFANENAQRNLQALTPLVRGALNLHESDPIFRPDLQKRAEEFVSDTILRVTVTDLDGKALADSEVDPKSLPNHLERPEFQQAARSGTGEDIRRSESTKFEYLYYTEQLYGRPAAAKNGDAKNGDAERGEPYGYLRIAVRLDHIREALLLNLRAVVAALTLSLLITVTVLFAITRRLSRTLETML